MSRLDDITEKIGALLSDEESMNQIKELAAMFSGGMNGGANAANAAGSVQGSFSPGTDNPAGNDPAGDNENAGADMGSTGGGINPLAVMQLLGAASDDKDCGLLLALRPHLSLEKQRRLDKAVKLLKLYNIFAAMRENGMLNDLENLL